MARKPRSEQEKARGRALAARLAEWRAATPGDELTQEALAARAGVRIDTLRSIEANKIVDPGFAVVAQIVRKGLNMSLDELAAEVLAQ